MLPNSFINKFKSVVLECHFSQSFPAAAVKVSYVWAACLCLNVPFIDKRTELQNGPDITVITYKNYIQILRIKKFYWWKIFTLIIVYWILSGKNFKQIQFKTL